MHIFQQGGRHGSAVNKCGALILVFSRQSIVVIAMVVSENEATIGVAEFGTKGSKGIHVQSRTCFNLVAGGCRIHPIAFGPTVIVFDNVGNRFPKSMKPVEYFQDAGGCSCPRKLLLQRFKAATSSSRRCVGIIIRPKFCVVRSHAHQSEVQKCHDNSLMDHSLFEECPLTLCVELNGNHRAPHSSLQPTQLQSYQRAVATMAVEHKVRGGR